MKLAVIAFRNLARNKRRTVLSVSTIVIACILGLFMLALISGMKEDMRKNILSYYTGALQIRHGEYEKYEHLSPVHLFVKNEADLREKLLTIDGVTAAVGRIKSGGKIYIDTTPSDDVPGEEYTAMAMGIDFAGEETILSPGSLLISGRLPEEGKREVVIGYGLAEKTGLNIGDRFSFMTATASRSTNAMTFEISGIVNFPLGGFNDTYFLLPFKVMQEFMRMEKGAGEIIVMTGDPDTAEIQHEEINRVLTSDTNTEYLTVKLWKNQGDFYAMMGMGEIVYNFMVLFFLALGATVIINTTMMVVFERYREIGILGAMGMTSSELVRLFFLEALFAGIISAVIGIGLGVIVVLGMERTGIDYGTAMNSMNMEVSNIIYPKLKIYQVVSMFFYTMGISALVTLIPARRAARIDPDRAIRGA